MAEVPGPIYARALDREKFFQEVERVAVLMCEELGEDPYQMVLRPGNPGYTCHRWECFTEQAKLALAGWRAVQRYILCES